MLQKPAGSALACRTSSCLCREDGVSARRRVWHDDAMTVPPRVPHPSTLITVAPTGAESSKADVPALPTTSEELVETAVRCEAAGAAMIHLHIRDAEHQPTLEIGRLTDAVDA